MQVVLGLLYHSAKLMSLLDLHGKYDGDDYFSPEAVSEAKVAYFAL